MKPLYFIVEGPTEVEFVNRLVIPYLIEQRQLQTHIQAIPVDISGGGHGYNNIEHFKNTIKPILSYRAEPVITSMLDYFAMNSETKMPGYTQCIESNNSTDDKIACLENSLQEQVQRIKSYRFFIPYIQKHEMETLLFANPEQGFELYSESIKQAVLDVVVEYPNIEDINSTPEGAPSKRLAAIFQDDRQKYNKVADCADIAELTGIDTMLVQCSRFSNWIEQIVQIVRNSN